MDLRRRGVPGQSRLSVLLAATLLGGCAGTAQYTKLEDPFNALNPGTVKALGKAKVCLVLTANTDRALEYAQEAQNNISGRFGHYADAEPKRLVSDLTEVFSSRFRETIRVRSQQEVATNGCQVVAALDLKIQLGSVSFQSNSAELSAALSDDKGTRLETVSGSGTSSVPFPNTGGNFKPAWLAAITKLGEAIDRSPRMNAYVASLPAPVAPVTAGVAAAASVTAIDLAFWDSVKDSKNPTDLRAYLDKFPNGSFSSLARSRIVSLGEPLPAVQRQLGTALGGAAANFGNYHALVIGIDRYRSVTPLKTAVNDAREVAAVLQSSYGFNVRLLLDPTRNQMLDAFDDLRRELRDNDNLVIYYAGHGYLDADTDRGFWLPVDAEANRRANWLSNSDITDTVRAIRAKHVMVVADSCYAGTLTRNLSVETSGLDDLSRLAQKRARTALTSGGLEPVEDAGGKGHSVFAAAFLDALRSNTGIADMSALFSSIRRRVLVAAQQTPQYGDIRQTGHEGGDFIFVKK